MARTASAFRAETIPFSFPCACGCGAFPNEGKRYITGHNNRDRKIRKPRVSWSCAFCSKSMSTTRAAAKNRTYCSADCRDNHRRERVGPLNPNYKRVEEDCKVCGTRFERTPKGLKYCSYPCSRLAQRRAISGSQAHRSNSWSAVEARDGRACRICGFRTVVHYHHIISRRRGGSNKADNLIMLCPNHHAMTHAGMLSAEDLKAAIAGTRPEPHGIENPAPIRYRAA